MAKNTDIAPKMKEQKIKLNKAQQEKLGMAQAQFAQAKNVLDLVLDGILTAAGVEQGNPVKMEDGFLIVEVPA